MIYGLSATRTMFKADAISTSTLNRSLFTNLSPLFYFLHIFVIDIFVKPSTKIVNVISKVFVVY